jgi:acetoin utilization deacetylase AcuC-like enzyme
MLKIAYSPLYKFDLPSGYRFPIVIYQLIYKQILADEGITEEHFFLPTPLEEEIILKTHTAEYWQRLKDQALTEKEIQLLGYPLSPELVVRSATIADATLKCALFAQKYGVSINITGGMHHAFSDHGEVFCLLNDVAIAANYLINNKLCKKILIIDLDVHQGSGTAEIFSQSPNKWREEAREQGGIFTFSMHGTKNYPIHKEQSNLDIALQDGVTDTQYLDILSKNLNMLFEKVQPGFVFFNAGIDVIKGDKLGRLALTIEGCSQRDKLVLEMCQKNNVPVAVVMGSGYNAKTATIVEAHFNTYKMVQAVFFQKNA